MQIENRSIVHFVYSMLRIWDFRPGARMLGSSSISFDVSLMELLPTLMSGNTLVLAQEHELAIPRNLVKLIKSTGVNMMAVTPGVWNKYLPTSRVRPACEISAKWVWAATLSTNGCFPRYSR